jgi:hypothetical protein
MNDCETCQQGGEGRGCACALWATRRALRIPDRQDTPLSSPEQMQGGAWWLAFIAAAALAFLAAYLWIEPALSR